MREERDHAEDGYEHGHPHIPQHPPVQPDDTSPPTHYELMILAMRDLLVEKSVLTADQIRRGLETLDSWQPSRGAEIVVRAWTNPEFKRRLPTMLTEEGPVLVELHTGLAEKTPMTDRGGLPFHRQIEALRTKLLRPRAS